VVAGEEEEAGAVAEDVVAGDPGSAIGLGARDLVRSGEAMRGSMPGRAWGPTGRTVRGTGSTAGRETEARAEDPEGTAAGDLAGEAEAGDAAGAPASSSPSC
jgi:hypothetical protein